MLHAAWDAVGPGALLVWGEVGDRAPGAPPPACCQTRQPQAGKAQARKAQARQRGPTDRAMPHPFAATTDALADALVAWGGSLLTDALGAADRVTVTLRLPGTIGLPDPSPWLVRFGGAPGVPARAGKGGGWHGVRPFSVPALRWAPGPALDVLLGLSVDGASTSRAAPSVTVLARIGELALELVAGARILPALVVDAAGCPQARWEPLQAAHDTERLVLLARALPLAACSLDGPGDPPTTAAHAFSALVDAACRAPLARTAALRVPGGGGSKALGAWIRALAAPEGAMRGVRGIATLVRQVEAWRATLVPPVGSWRLCFRLEEPAAGSGGTRGTEGSAPWRVALFLQAADDPSLLVGAAEVWRASESLRRAARTVDAPQEVLLAELGRAVHAFPDLCVVLAQPAPTVLELDVAGAHRFLVEVAPALELAGFGVLLPSWWRRRATRLGLRLRAGPAGPATLGSARRAGGLTLQGLATVDWQVVFGDDEVDLAELRRLARLKAPLVQVRGQWMELRRDELDKLVAFLGAGRAQQMSLVDLVRAASGVAPPGAGVPVVGVEATGVLGDLLRGDVVARLSVPPTPEGFSGELRLYQRRGVGWIELLEATGLGACLADDMGLGKTATVLGVLQAERLRSMQRARGRSGRQPASPGPTLVVCPTSVVGNWVAEVRRFTPELRVVVHHGADRARGETLSSVAAQADVVVTSYPLVERDRVAMSSVAWWRVVLDEAQQVKNPLAKQTQAVRGIRAPRRLALTGTPVENHLGELWSIMEILNPGLLGSQSSFRERFAVPIERYGDAQAADRLRALTRPFVLRRLKTDKSIISDLPEKMEMKVRCSLTREQATLYQAVVDDMLEQIAGAEGIERKGLVLATMLRLKQVCNHPSQYLADGSALAGRSGKLERTGELLEEVREAGEKALVFTQFSEMGAMLQEHLQQRLGCRVGFLHGGVARAHRDELVAELQAPDEALPVMVLSLKAGGTGLNLTGANHVVHYDRWWNPAVEDQATDRAFRIGQPRDVQVRKLVCAGTVEDRIDEMIESKRALADRVVGAGEAWLTELSTDELAGVVRLSPEAVME